jgi:hypothetical protein
MTRTTRITLVAAATILSGVAVDLWALRPLGFASYLSSTAAGEADIIRQYWPHRLVEPEWVSSVPGRLLNWHLTEAIARLALVFALWLLFICVAGRGVAFTLVWRRGRKTNNQHRADQNQPFSSVSISGPAAAGSRRPCRLFVIASVASQTQEPRSGFQNIAPGWNARGPGRDPTRGYCENKHLPPRSFPNGEGRGGASQIDRSTPQP